MPPDVVVLVWVVSAVLTLAISAARRLGEPVTWIIVGLVLGPIGMFWALMKKAPTAL